MDKLNIRTMKLADLNPAKYNPRKELKPGDPEFEKLKNSIENFGYVELIVVNEANGNTVISGHQRLSVLKHLGETEAECVIVNMNEADEKALNIAMNKVSGEWDTVKLADLLEDLRSLDYDLAKTGFEAAEIDDLFSNVHNKDVQEDSFDVDKAAAAPAFVEPGDVWTLGKHRLMCGDSTDPAAVAILMDGRKANLCITDPPYNCAYQGGTGMTIMNDRMENDKFYQFLLAAMKNVYDSLADGGALYVFHSDAEKVNFFNATVDAGFHYSTTCIWVKNSLVLGRMDYQMQHEPVIYAFKDTAKHKFYGDRKQTTIWNFDRPTKSKLHPTMKPLPLVAYPMRNSSQVNGLVLDLFGGSGSTLMAADQLDRIAFLMELDSKYASAIIRRYAASHGSTAGITVLRNGEIHNCDEFYVPTEDDLSYKDGSVNAAQRGGADDGTDTDD
ncbi:MAG: site-specific DNA-methyltransferase [Oscillospiraceae bacterium]|nr:site-specific DNA-methyltransferase [Oscillospiraceae bacterium]